MSDLAQFSSGELATEIQRRSLEPWVKLASALRVSPRTLRLLGQEKIWVSVDGEIEIDDMTPEHRSNLLSWLEQRKDRLKMMEEIELCAPSAFGQPPDDVVDEMLSISADEWFEDQPLVRRLRREIA